MGGNFSQWIFFAGGPKCRFINTETFCEFVPIFSNCFSWGKKKDLFHHLIQPLAKCLSMGLINSLTSTPATPVFKQCYSKTQPSTLETKLVPQGRCEEFSESLWTLKDFCMDCRLATAACSLLTHASLLRLWAHWSEYHCFWSIWTVPGMLWVLPKQISYWS